MKRILLFSSMIIAVFISLTVSRSHAKLDVLREVDSLVEAGRPNLLIVVDHNRAMAGDYTETGAGSSTHDDSNINSRFFQMKDVMRGLNDGSSGGTIKPEKAVLETTKGMVNYGLMAFEQFNYWPYYTADCQTDWDDCDKIDPVITMDPVANDGNFPGVSFTYNSAGGHVGTAGTAAPVDGTTYYHYNYATGSPTKDDPIIFDDGNIGSKEGKMRGGKVWIDIDPTQDPTWNIDYIKGFFKLGNQGGLVVSGNSADIQKMFKDSTAPAQNVWDYFLNDVIPNDPGNTTGCFTKNYVILLASGTNNSANWTQLANDAKDLRDGITYNGYNYPVKTFVIGFLDTSTVGGNLRSNLNNVARKGLTDANDPNGLYGLNPSADTNFGADPDDTGDDATSCSGTEALGNGGCNDYAFFVTSAADLQDAFEKIIKAISGGDFVTGAPSATSSGGSFVLNDVGILASTEYPEWRGHLRAVDLINDRFWWDAGVTLFVDAADVNLPNAVVNANVADKDASWRDTDGDGTVDQPPLTITVVSGDTYQYTDKVLYCRAGTDCNSSELTSNEYVDTTVTFSLNGVDTDYTYKGAFYMPPWEDRKVYTSQLTGSLLSFTTSNWSTINALAGWGVGENEAKAIINFALGGVDSDKDGTVEEAKEWWLGDITNVVSIGVGKPIDPKDGLTGRSTFREDFAGRSTVIYTGSNDQMLHAYDFATGNELFAYIPPGLLANLKTLYENAMSSVNPAGFMGQPADPADHIYGIANSPKVNDVQFADGTWHTVLVTGEGPRGSNYVAGNNHYFALDITHPNGSSDYSGSSTFSSIQRYNNSTAPFDLLWHTKETSLESSYSYSTKLGETWSVPAFGRVLDGSDYKWVVFAGSGYDDNTYSDEKGRTYNVINVEDGNLIEDVVTDSPGTTSVQFGLLPDSVSIIKKSGSRVYTSYQVDLVGRIWHLDTTSSTTSNWTSAWTSGAGGYNSLEKTSGAAERQFSPSNTKPFYYSPAVWDFDNTDNDALNLMILGSGAYDDVDSDSLDTDLYFLIVDPATSQITDAITIDATAVTGTSYVDTEGNTVSSSSLSGAKLVASPVLFNNKTSGSLEALFLLFVPPASAELGCSFGASYLLIFDLGSPDTYTGSTNTFVTGSGSAMKDVMDQKAKFVVSMGSGKVSGIGIAGGGSHVIVGQSGYGGGDTSGFNTAGGNTWDPIGDVTKLFWKEVN